MLRFLALSALSLVSMASISDADVLVIDFDSLPASTGFAGVPSLSNEYAADNLLFSGPAPGEGGAVLDQGGNFGVNARSGTQFLAFNDTASSQTGTANGPERITLTAESARSVSVWVSGGGDATTFSLTAFAQGSPVGTPATVMVPAGTWGELQFSAPGGFDSFEIDETGTDPHWVLDDLTLELGTPLNSLCFGDGSGMTCPCGNSGGAGEGCANSTGVGASLDGDGNSIVAADTFTLSVSQAPANRPGLFFQGTMDVNGGIGSLFGDGLRCAGGQVTRLATVVTDGSGAAALPQPVTTLTAIAQGDTRTYQYWYRDPGVGPCGQGFNLTNAVQVTWE